MWSVVEKTALAEAEVEYEEHTSDTISWLSRFGTVVSDGPATDVASRSLEYARRSLLQRSGGISRNLEYHPLDYPGQSSYLIFTAN